MSKFPCVFDGCSKAFETKLARHNHRRDKHEKPLRHQPGQNKPPRAGMMPNDVYEMVEAMDLPDGAHWAMIEELSGFEPGDFA